MVVVAIIGGGTGSVGRAITEAFVQNGEHETIIVSRKVHRCIDEV